MKIDNKVAIVVGGVQGTGRAFCEALLAKGSKLIVGDILVSDGQKMQVELGAQYGEDKVVFRKCDVSIEQEVAALFTLAEEKWGSHPDIVANIVGIVDEVDWRRAIDVNIVGLIHVATCCLEKMGKDKGGRGGCFVAMASLAALRPEIIGPVYVATKHATLGYIRSWALKPHYSRHGIRMNCLCPTAVDTGFLEGMRNKIYFSKQIMSRLPLLQNKLSTKTVADAFIKVVEDDDINGEAVRVTHALGVDFATFQDTPDQ